MWVCKKFRPRTTADWRITSERHERSGGGPDGTTDYSGPCSGYQNLASLVGSAILASIAPSNWYAGLAIINAISD